MFLTASKRYSVVSPVRVRYKINVAKLEETNSPFIENCSYCVLWTDLFEILVFLGKLCDILSSAHLLLGELLRWKKDKKKRCQ